jgi:hypothetical protein
MHIITYQYLTTTSHITAIRTSTMPPVNWAPADLCDAFSNLRLKSGELRARAAEKKRQQNLHEEKRLFEEYRRQFHRYRTNLRHTLHWQEAYLVDMITFRRFLRWMEREVEKDAEGLGVRADELVEHWVGEVCTVVPGPLVA